MSRICPVCNKEYDDYPALSRKDNETEICPECGVVEALEDFASFVRENKKEKKQKNVSERIKMIKAMEFIARQINDEDIFETWLTYGIADGDINYGDLDVFDSDKEYLDYYYIEDDVFKDIMGVFLNIMKRAEKSGGLYCDNVVSSN